MTVQEGIDILLACPNKEAELLKHIPETNTYIRVSSIGPLLALHEFPNTGSVVDHATGWVEKGVQNFEQINLAPVQAYVVS